MFHGGNTRLQSARRKMLRLLRERGIHDERVLRALDNVPREQFVPPQWIALAYADRALPIQCDQTISQPYIVALMTEALGLNGTERVLEIGTGSGYQTCVLAQLAREVITIERHAPLQHLAQSRLEGLGYHNITYRLGDGTAGCQELAPFDRIIATAAAGHLPPALGEQLAEGGILVIPVGGSQAQELQALRKRGGKLESRTLTACRFVPLVGDAD